MKHIRRLLVGFMAGLALVGVMGGAGTPAGAASVYWVDDTPANNGKVKCPAGAFTTIEAARAQITTDGVTSNVTLNICPGFYNPPGGFTFNSFTNLKVLGKGGPIINAPIGFEGVAFAFLGSNKVTVQGLSINGRGLLGDGSSSAAIYFSGTTGIIKGNMITRWHQDYAVGPPPYAPTDPAYAIIDAAPTQVKKVTIEKNTIYDSQDVGILVYEAGAARVIKNRIVFSSAVNAAFDFGAVSPQVGIAVLQGNGVTVSGNQIQSDSDLFPANADSRGILLYSTSFSKVTKNTIRGTANQISIESHCDSAIYPNANNNKVTGNKLYDSWWNGLSIWAVDDGGGCATPHADRNTATGNKIYNSNLSVTTPFGVYLLADGAGAVIDRPTIKGNTFAGFYPGYHIYLYITGGAALTNQTLAPNKVLSTPPTGPLASPSPDVRTAPAPLPASFLNPF